MVTGVSLGKSFWVVNTWRAAVRKPFKGPTLGFAHTFLTDCCTKPWTQFFLIMNYSFFIAITRRALKAYFTWKQLRVDYAKNIWKEENRRHGFVCFLVSHISVKKIIENCISVGAGPQNVGGKVSFWPNFQSNYWYLESVNKVNYIYWERLVIVHLRRYYNKNVCNCTVMFFNIFLFCLKG